MPKMGSFRVAWIIQYLLLHKGSSKRLNDLRWNCFPQKFTDDLKHDFWLVVHQVMLGRGQNLTQREAACCVFVVQYVQFVYWQCYHCTYKMTYSVEPVYPLYVPVYPGHISHRPISNTYHHISYLGSHWFLSLLLLFICAALHMKNCCIPELIYTLQRTILRGSLMYVHANVKMSARVWEVVTLVLCRYTWEK